MMYGHAHRKPRRLSLVLAALIAGGMCGGSPALAVDPQAKSDPVSDALVGKSAPPPGAVKPAPAAYSSNSAPTPDDVQLALDQRDFASAVKFASKLLALRGNAAAGLSRYQLFTLKGDGQIGLKFTSAAIESYQAAIKETVDPHEIAIARSTLLLLHHSSGSNFVAKTTGPDGVKPGPLDLTDKDQRKSAFGALLNDMLTPLAPRIKGAMTSQSLVQIWPVLQQVQELHTLDVIANGNDDKTTQTTGGLVEHARTLITTALKGMWQRVDDIDKFANSTTNVQQNLAAPNGAMIAQNTARKNGLSEDNKRELSDIMQSCGQIQSAADAFSQSAATDKDKEWASITSDANRVGLRAKDVLNANYYDLTTNGNGYGSGYGGGYGGGYGAGYGSPPIVIIQSGPGIGMISTTKPPVAPPTTRGSH